MKSCVRFVWLCTIASFIPLNSFGSTSTASNSAYIRDLEGLISAVESKDSTRPQLTLKLADALFNDALLLAGQPSLSAAEKQKMTAERRRAIGLYSDALEGLKGMFPKPSGVARGKIQFQLARLYADLNDTTRAEKIWTELAAQDSMPELQRESSLRLAEVLENRGSPADLKRSEGYYQKALTLCGSQDVCSYAHYRLGWILRRQNRLPEAIAEMNQALWDSKGQVREESLRDLLAFQGEQVDDGKESTAQMESLSTKLKRPTLLSELADAYFSRGNRKAGIYVLDVVNRKHPTIKSFVRLMEEDYGFRDWQKFDTELDGAIDLVSTGEGRSADAETEKILRRLTVQLDGERASKKESAEAFKKSVLFYLSLYPERSERKQMIDGWCAAETDDAAKVAQLKVWIAEERAAKRTEEELRLRKIRAAVAQKSKNIPVVIEEMSELLALTQKSAERREIAYQIAYAQYESKDYVNALTGFQKLAVVSPGGAVDKWAIRSEHLALDILAQKKDYAGVQKQAQLWTKDERFPQWLKTYKEHHEELADLNRVEGSARFEWATAQGQTPEALAIFAQACRENELLPQSCANAQVLAVKLGDQKALIEVLQKLGKRDELAAELEASAEFAEAAAILEKSLDLQGKKAVPRDYLKVALLYELGASQVNRDRVLHLLTGRLAGQKTLPVEEDLILQTLKDADLLQLPLLKLRWKPVNRDYIVDVLVQKGVAGADLQNQLLKTCHDTGPAWRKATMQELARLDEKQAAIHFAGKNSKRLFTSRTAALKILGERANCYLQSTSPEQRVAIASLLAKSEDGIANEIKDSPIPEGVDSDGQASLQRALAELAQPFVDKASELNKLADEQRSKVQADSSPSVPKTSEPSANLRTQAVADLHRNPNQRASLTQLKDYYESSGNTRLAAYFHGRLLQLGDSGGADSGERIKQ